MKAVVKSRFKDKYTGEVYEENHILENISEDRFKEILTVGKLVEEIKDEVKPNKKAKKPNKKNEE